MNRAVGQRYAKSHCASYCFSKSYTSQNIYSVIPVVLGLAPAPLGAVAGFLLSVDAAAGMLPLFVEVTAGLVVPTGFRSAAFVWVLAAAAAEGGPFLAWAAAPARVVFFASDDAAASLLVAPFAAVLATPLATRFWAGAGRDAPLVVVVLVTAVPGLVFTGALVLVLGCDVLPLFTFAGGGTVDSAPCTFTGSSCCGGDGLWSSWGCSSLAASSAISAASGASVGSAGAVATPSGFISSVAGWVLGCSNPCSLDLVRSTLNQDVSQDKFSKK